MAGSVMMSGRRLAYQNDVGCNDSTHQHGGEGEVGGNSGDA